MEQNKITIFTHTSAYHGAIAVTTFMAVISILTALFPLLLFKLEFLQEFIYYPWLSFFLFLWPLLFLLQVQTKLNQRNYKDWPRQIIRIWEVWSVLTFFSGSFANDGGKKDGTYLEKRMLCIRYLWIHLSNMGLWEQQKQRIADMMVFQAFSLQLVKFQLCYFGLYYNQNPDNIMMQTMELRFPNKAWSDHNLY